MLARVALIATLAATLLIPALPAQAQSSDQKPAKTVQNKKDVQGMDFDFVDSENAYWVNRGVNDAIYNAGYSVNAVRNERDQARVGKMLNLYKPAQVVEVKVHGRTVTPPTPALRLNGRVVPVDR